MIERDLIWLRQMRETAAEMLSENITSEQRDRLRRIINRIDMEMRKADTGERSRLRRSTRVI